VNLTETIDGCSKILSGVGDRLFESAFYMIGNYEEAVEKAAKSASVD
jgi:F0F1-type ATP synthase beta subunit